MWALIDSSLSIEPTYLREKALWKDLERKGCHQPLIFVSLNILLLLMAFSSENYQAINSWKRE